MHFPWKRRRNFSVSILQWCRLLPDIDVSMSLGGGDVTLFGSKRGEEAKYLVLRAGGSEFVATAGLGASC